MSKVNFKNLFNSILTGLVVAGLFSATLYVFAVPPDSKYSFSETLNPSCAPSSTNCAVESPALYSFGSNNFSGTGTFTTTGALSAGAITGTSFTDSTTTITGGNYTGVGNITGTDVDISAGTGDFSTSGTGTFGIGRFTTGLKDNAGTPLLSIDTGNRKLYASDGTTMMMNYSNFPGTSTAISIFLAGAGNTTMTGDNNFFVGNYAGYLNSTGYNNNFLGNYAGYLNSTGNNNNFLGYYAGYLNSTGSYNVALGSYAGYTNSTGSNDVFIGPYAGKYETGSNALYIDNQDRTNTAGDKAKALIYGVFDAVAANQSITFNVGTAGFGAGAITTTGAIAAGAYKAGATAGVSCTDVTVTSVNGIVTACGASDLRLKETVEPISSVSVLEKLSNIRGVYYNWNNEYKEVSQRKNIEQRQIGMIAQELQQEFPELVTEQPNKFLSINYSSFTAVLLEGLKELNAKVNSLNPNGAWGSGEISGVNTSSALDSVKSALLSLGISIKDGVTNITQLAVEKSNTKTARVERLEMVDKLSGDIYCTWIENGEWKKAQGECSSIDILTQVQVQVQIQQEPAVAEVQLQEPAVSTQEIVQQVTEQVVQQTQQATKRAAQEVAQQVTQQVTQQQEQTTKQAAKQAAKEIKEEIKQEVKKELQQEADEIASPSPDGSARNDGGSDNSSLRGAPQGDEAISVVEEQPAPVEEALPSEEVPAEPTIGDIIQESAAGLLNSMWEFLKGIINLGAKKVSSIPVIQKASAGLLQFFNQTKKDIEISLQETTPKLIENSSAGLLSPFQKISEPLQDLWQKIEKLIRR